MKENYDRPIGSLLRSDAELREEARKKGHQATLADKKYKNCLTDDMRQNILGILVGMFQMLCLMPSITFFLDPSFVPY